MAHVKGYMIVSCVNETSFEVLFSDEGANGVWKSETIDTTSCPNHSFDCPGRKWTRVDALPEGACFIGNYESVKGKQH